MVELVTEAVVFDKEDLGESDSRIFLYTRDLGKIIAKAKSARKITSKLAAHLQPLNYITVRLAAKKDFDGRGFQITDALLRNEAPNSRINNSDNLKKAIKIVRLINLAVPENTPDQALWNFIYQLSAGEGNFKLSDAFQLLGFNPAFASCELCGKGKPDYFFGEKEIFVCRTCGSGLGAPRKENFISVND